MAMKNSVDQDEERARREEERKARAAKADPDLASPEEIDVAVDIDHGGG